LDEDKEVLGESEDESINSDKGEDDEEEDENDDESEDQADPKLPKSNQLLVKRKNPKSQ